jgi:hypothetical protein
LSNKEKIPHQKYQSGVTHGNTCGAKTGTRDELNDLPKDLTRRGINESVLNSIKESEKQI